MTPAKAIKLECRYCMGNLRKPCESKICPLNNKSLSRLKRIKAHCLGCVEKQSEVRTCSGKLLHEERLCYLHEYRRGHNPKRKGIGGVKIYANSLIHDMVLTA